MRVARRIPGGKHPCASIFGGIFVGLSASPPSAFVHAPNLPSCAVLLAYFSCARFLRVLSPSLLHLPSLALFCPVRAVSMLRMHQQGLYHPCHRRRGFLPLFPLKQKRLVYINYSPVKENTYFQPIRDVYSPPQGRDFVAVVPPLPAPSSVELPRYLVLFAPSQQL